MLIPRSGINIANVTDTLGERDSLPVGAGNDKTGTV